MGEHLYKCPLCDEVRSMSGLNYHLRAEHDMDAEEAFDMAGHGEHVPNAEEPF